MRGSTISMPLEVWRRALKTTINSPADCRIRSSIILAARPSMGKTALAMNIAEHVAVQLRMPVLFVSLEMSALELGDRLLCSIAEVNSHRLRNGTITSEERRKLVKTAGEISEAPLYIDDSPSRTMTEIAANARRLKRRENLGLDRDRLSAAHRA